MSKPPIDTTVIDSAPTSTAASQIELTGPEEEQWRQKFLDLSERHEELKEEYDTLRRNSSEASQILNGLITPYANNIFRFMCWYCIFVGAMLFLNSCGKFDWRISDTVMSILVGSTATTVLGLVAMIVSGIFNGARHGPARTKASE
ncbi:hypothetical protein [Asticcacaulis excentricus]|uniref:Transmembrane protein n=1 Tax=Asticcacaulis excentricus (strain ATCC 15261 / DSM 4724 / KCTC 12464 / NCIMB 9791 / VKM B-1370 / CB 48) TaxID=573065 RepID=E8RPL7_ASTEC|nr:hypothetical protein [Asticcacaulis excentricus]ADU11994.1 hypothetical protein Astex_0296 [Asticcacaulis excentricus CB 48]